MTHGTFSGNGYKKIEVEGQNFKVLMGTDPEEVAEWRNQRRKKFPTRQVTEEKRAREEQRLQAGGLLSGGGRQGQGQEHGVTGRASKKRGRQECRVGGHPSTTTAGIGSMITQGNKLIEEGGEQGGVEAVCEHASCEDGKGVVEGDTAKTSTDGTSDSARPSPVVFHDGADAGTNQSTKGTTGTLCLTFQRKGSCKYGKRCYFIHGDITSSKGESKNTRKHARIGDKDCKMDNKGKDPKKIKNLYGKLVECEIEKEDNIILQCFRYFVQTEFE